MFLKLNFLYGKRTTLNRKKVRTFFKAKFFEVAFSNPIKKGKSTTTADHTNLVPAEAYTKLTIVFESFGGKTGSSNKCGYI